MNRIDMKRIRLIHWKSEESPERARRLRAAGYAVDFEPLNPAALRRLRENPPAAVVIDLSRLPMQGRDLGLAVRHYKSTRGVPLVFVDGAPEKVARVKKDLPDAVYTTWSRVRGALKKALAHPPALTRKPRSLLEGYSGTPLMKKLGIQAGYTVALSGAPEGFESILGPLPMDVTLRRQARGHCDLIVWFTRTRKDLERRVKRMGALAGKGGLWIAWPKKASGMATDLDQTVVRKTGLASGLVDYKVCAVDETWSGLRFTQRKR